MQSKYPAPIDLRFYLGRWIVSCDGIDLRSFKTNAAANRYAARMRGDELRIPLDPWGSDPDRTTRHWSPEVTT